WIAQSASIPLAKSTSWPAANLKLDPESFCARILVAFGFRLLRVWSHTIRFEIEDRAKILQTPVSERFIGAAWHNRLLLLPFALRRFIPQRPGAALISPRRLWARLANLVVRFARVRFILGQHHEVLKASDEEDFERERERLKSAMMALVKMR